MTADELVQEVQAAGIDVDSAASRILRWLNHLIREAAVESEWIRGTPQIGTTVVGQADYPLPTNVAKVRDLRVAGRAYERTGLRTGWDLTSTDVTVGDRGVFVEGYSDDGTVKQVTLYPVPNKAGDPIEAYAVLYPSSISGSAASPLPDDFDFPLVHGAIAKGLAFGDEDDAGAQYHQSIFDAAKEKLRRQANARLRSSGGSRVLIRGFDF